MNNAIESIEEYETIVNRFHAEMEQVPERFTGVRPAADKWSLKDIVGHLIDSACNNHQRFIRLQHGKILELPGYDQEKWVASSVYTEYDWHNLLTLWYSYNELIVHLIRHVDKSSLSNSWNHEGELLPLEHLIPDYFKHMQWHEKQFAERLAEVRAQKS